MPIIPITGNVQPPIGYNLPVSDYSIQMRDFADSLSYFSVFTDSCIYSYKRSDAEYNQTDYINYEGHFSTTSNDIYDKNIDLQAIKVQQNDEESFQIQNCLISQNDSIAIDIVGDSFELSYSGNDSDDTSYNLLIQYVSETIDTTFEHKNITLQKNSIQIVSPDLDNFDHIPIYIDEDMNGSIDDTLYVSNQYYTPSTGGSLNDKNIYIYPNPFNPIEQDGTIRYSLTEDGEVTIKIYDIGGNLVRTLIDDESQSAVDEQSVAWDGKNDKGDVVANGVYFYVIDSSSGEKATGKAAIIK